MAKFLYRSIPQYSREILDILKDVQTVDGETIEVKPLEEYLDNIDTLTFESIREYIKGILTLNDIDKVPDAYLPYLSYILGHVWDPELDANYQRFLLKSIVQLYKRKGTRFHIHYNLAYFDKDVKISENYRNIFILNKSLLDGDHKLSSWEYSWGVYTVRSSYDPVTVRKIVDATRPAGWKSIFETELGGSSSTLTRPEDNYWEIIKKTSWYTDGYIDSLKNYLIWGSVDFDTRNLLYEDPTGYFIRGIGKRIGLPRNYSLNEINAVSSRKRIFSGIDRSFCIGGYGDTGVYLGPTFLPDTLFTVGQFGSETLTLSDRTSDKNLFLGSSNSLISDPHTTIGKADRHDGGSLFKNFLNYSMEDWAHVGPILPDVQSVYEIGDRKWLEYDRKEIPYTETSSVYMGLKMILWSSTSAPFYTDKMPYDSYGGYQFDQRDLDYYFFIHRAFSPHKYSRAIDYGCRLVSGLLPDDTDIVLSDYKDLPFTGTLVFNNEFIEYEKIIDNSCWAKIFVNGVEAKQSSRKVDSFCYDVTYSHAGTKYKFWINKTGNKELNFKFYRNGILQTENTDYFVVDRSNYIVHIQNYTTGLEIQVIAETDNPSNWRIIHSNVEPVLSYSLSSHIESMNFYADSDKYDIAFDKTEENHYKCEISLNREFSLSFEINLESNSLISNIGEGSYSYPIDQVSYVGNYELEYDLESKNTVVYNRKNDRNIVINFGEYGVKEDISVKVEDTEVWNASATSLTDRLDAVLKIDGISRTIYGAADKKGVFQIFYSEGKKRLKEGEDYDLTLLPRTVQIYDKTLKKTIMIKYHNQPSIPIKRRFISVLGWGNKQKDNITIPGGFKPRLLTRNDMIEYKYKLHKLNDMSVEIIHIDYPETNLYIGYPREYKGSSVFIVQLHNQDNRVRNLNTVSFGAYEFLGKQIIPRYAQLPFRHISTHVIDKKSLINGKRSSASLNLGRKQPLDGLLKDKDGDPLEIVLGGAGDQNRMAFNRSDQVYEEYKWHSIGAPITDLSGKSYVLDKDKRLYRYLLGERKLLGNRLPKEYNPLVKTEIPVDMGIARFVSDPIRARNSVEIGIESSINSNLGASIIALQSSSYGLLFRLPIEISESSEENEFTLDSKDNGIIGNASVVINKALSTNGSISTTSIAFSDVKIFNLNPVISSIKSVYRLGSRNALGNGIFSVYPTEYSDIGKAVLSSPQSVISFPLDIGIASKSSLGPSISVEDVAPISKYGNHRISELLDSIEDIAKEARISILEGEGTTLGLLSGSTEFNSGTLLNKNIICMSNTRSRSLPLIIGDPECILGEKYFLGNKIPAEN